MSFCLRYHRCDAARWINESAVRPRHHARGDINIPPDDLYRNGLQRARFLPAIEAIKQYCDIMNVDAGVDYRLRTLTRAHLWLSPLNDETQRQMDKLWLALAGSKVNMRRRLR